MWIEKRASPAPFFHRPASSQCSSISPHRIAPRKCLDWLNTFYFALKGLKDYGHTNTSESLRTTLLGWVSTNDDSIYEYYEPKTGQGLAAKSFGWSPTITISFILDWDNDNLTWLFQGIPSYQAGPVKASRASFLHF
jgi:hypothetical protein